ncbi:unnamed protein product [Blepharisma stoltei]|uniref:PX domain-containing protein n=1 Tax=Blepharisma stoltei TaxID=1481888 RepID=A0AAU9IUX2_9CILI|nr:unnamed protein product [Blepharisma stoltei]
MELGVFGATIDRHYESPDHVIFYVIKVWHTLSKISWTVDKRYSQFDAFHKDLLKKFPGIPQLPKKTLWKKYSNSFLNNRQQGINEFLQGILSRQDIAESEEIKKFLQLDQFIPKPRFNAPELISKLDTEGKPISLTIFKSLLFVCSKLKGNFQQKSEESSLEEDEKNAINGAVTLMNSRQGYIYNESWKIPFATEVTCMSWNEHLDILSIGTEEGIIFCYRARTDIGCTQYDDYCTLTNHNKNIIGIVVNHTNSTLYSCSEDNKLISVLLNEEINEIAEAEFPGIPVSAVSDFSASKILIATKSNGILIFDVASLTPIFIQNINTNIEIISMNICLNGNFFIGTGNSELNIYQKAEGNNFELQQSIKARTLLSVMIYANSRDEIFGGNSEGVLHIWNFTTGVLSFTWKAHESAILCLNYIENEDVLLSSAENGEIKVWRLPKLTKDPSFYDRGKFKAEVIFQT